MTDPSRMLPAAVVAEIKVLIRKGLQHTAIARRLTVSKSTVSRYAMEQEPGEPGKKKKRRCLRCEKWFMSEGIHNRLCQTCKVWINRCEPGRPAD